MNNKDKTYTREASQQNIDTEYVKTCCGISEDLLGSYNKITSSNDGLYMIYEKLEPVENLEISPMPNYFQPYFTKEELEMMIKLLGGFGKLTLPLIDKLEKLHSDK